MHLIWKTTWLLVWKTDSGLNPWPVATCYQCTPPWHIWLLCFLQVDREVIYLDWRCIPRTPSGRNHHRDSWPCGHCQSLGWIFKRPVLFFLLSWVGQNTNHFPSSSVYLLELSGNEQLHARTQKMWAGNSINISVLQKQINIIYNLGPFGLCFTFIKGCHDVSIFISEKEQKAWDIYFFFYF